MKDYWWKIKISDLLRHPGKEDTIQFEKKFIPDMDTLTENGISWQVTVKALDRYSILATIENLQADIHDISDISWKPYIRHAVNQFYEGLFIIPHEENKKIRGKDEADEYFEINEKDESIDITEFIENALISVQPVVKKLPDENLSDSWEDVESEYDQYV